MRLSVLPGEFAVGRLGPADPIPAWATAGEWFSITRTARELSLVAPASRFPAGVRGSRGWRCLEVDGPLDLSEVGVVASLAGPLADAGVSVSVIATHDTDHLLVRDADLPRAIGILEGAGHEIQGSRNPVTSREVDR